jgi:superfamily II RNA helicase
VFGADNVGIMTGDNQYNPTAPVLIMTTEILRNFLLDGRTRKHKVETIEEDSDENEESTQYWTMDVAADVAAVVFDEVHYL